MILNGFDRISIMHLACPPIVDPFSVLDTLFKRAAPHFLSINGTAGGPRVGDTPLVATEPEGIVDKIGEGVVPVRIPVFRIALDPEEWEDRCLIIERNFSDEIGPAPHPAFSAKNYYRPVAISLPSNR